MAEQAEDDLLEQQQAMEQARLLQRFRELRQWQLQQQEQLMHQQRSQLEMLKHEQIKVQTMLNKEREHQWGPGKVIRQHGGISPTKTPPKRRPPLPANNELFTALASLIGGSQDPLALTMDQSVKSQSSSLPMPVMYGPPDPAMDDTSTNPDLFSSPGSRRNYQTEVDEGVCPIPDNASEISDGSYLPHSRKKGFIRTQPFLGDMASDTVSVLSDGSYVPPKFQNSGRMDSNQSAMSPNAASLLQTLLQTTDAHTLKQMLGLSQPETVFIPDQPQKVPLQRGRLDFNDNCAVPQREMEDRLGHPDMQRLIDPERDRLPDTERYPRHVDSENDVREFRSQNSQDVQPSRSRSNESQDMESSDRDLGKRHYDLQRLLPGQRGEGHRHDLIEDVIEEESMLEDTDEQDVTVEEQRERRPLGIDDRPIKTGAVGKKTFEQLLEEQLKEEEERLRAGLTDSPSVKKKPFLRKGQGLARYGPGKRSPKQPSASSSKEQVTESRSVTDNRPVAKSKPNKPAPKTKKQQASVQSSKSREQAASSQGKNVKKVASPRQKPKPKQSPRQKTPPKHSTPTGPDPPPSPSKKSEVKVPEIRESEPFADDASFVSKIKRIEENKKVEEDELEVFELLEDFADNVSFCSNSSVVSRLLQQQRDRDKNTTNIAGVKAVIEAKKAEKEQKTVQPYKAVSPKHGNNHGNFNSSLIDGVDLDTSSDTITESSSSETSSDEDENVLTPKKSGLNVKKDKGPNGINVVGSYDSFFDKSQEDGFVFVNKPQVNSDMFRSSDSEVRSSVPLSPTKSMTRKIATKESRDDFFSDKDDNDQPGAENLMATLKANAFAFGNTNHSSSVEKAELLNEMFGNKKTTNIGVQHLDESGEESEDSITHAKTVQQKVLDRVASPDFDDEEEWTVSAPQTQVALLDKEESEKKKSSTPPTSRLVSRLFPNLKNPKQVKEAEKKEQDHHKLEAASKTVVGDGVQSKILRDKLAELEKEIEKFRNENASLEKLRKDREDLLGKLKQEICDFEKEKDDELKRLEEFRTQETKKLKQERKMFEQYQKTVRSMPDKREREEIEALKRQLSELQDEVKKKEGRWTSANNRMRQRLEIVEMENKELKEEIKLLEKRRLETLQRESQKKNGVQKTFPRSSTPTEDAVVRRPTSDTDTAITNLTSLSHDSTLKSTLHQPIVNGVHHMHSHDAPVSRPSHATANPRPTPNSLAPSSVPNPAHNISGDAIPRGQPTGPSRTRSDSQSPDDDSSTGAVVNLPRKQSAKFSSENPAIDKGDREFEESQYPDGKVERTYNNGAREILFANGTRKEISSDGQSIVVSFFNGDIKQIFPDQRVVYFYADAQTTHTTYPDGLEILQFQNNQIEKHYPDGTKEITFPDQTIKYLFPNGSEESIFPDGTVIRVEKNGDKAMEFPNGQREVHTEAFKRREYPDGTVKTVYPDGRQETRYSTGRIRLKDKDGNVIMDRMC